MSGSARGSGLVPTGHAQEVFVSDFSFREAYRANEGNPYDATSKKRKREHKGDPSIVTGPGAYKGPWAKYELVRPDAASDEEYEEVEVTEDEEDEADGQPAPAPKRLAGTAYQDLEKETTEFVGSQEVDYQGRSWVHVPRDVDIKLTGERGDIKNYHPKKLIHTFKYHTKAINQVRFFPDSGHLLLSASADSRIAIWDTYHDRELLRTYSGHTGSVLDIDFNPTGTQFLSASYDRYMKLWDTETGKVVNKFKYTQTPRVVRFNPSKPHEFIAGMSKNTNKIGMMVQYDTRSGEIVQEYSHHFGSVNTIDWVDEGRRFVSTDDDLRILMFEEGMNVPVTICHEPTDFTKVSLSPL
jgi:pre-mRNA-processing factor 17